MLRQELNPLIKQDKQASFIVQRGKVTQQPDFRQELRRREREVELIQSTQQLVFLEEGGQVGRRSQRGPHG